MKRLFAVVAAILVVGSIFMAGYLLGYDHGFYDQQLSFPSRFN